MFPTRRWEIQDAVPRRPRQFGIGRFVGGKLYGAPSGDDETKEAGSNEVLSIPPAFLLVPPELEETAYNLFVRNTNNDPQYVQTVKPEIIPIWYATDADDWYLAADPADITGIEIGFLDGNEEPELFVQDNPTSGSVFTNDQITYKIRHIYGGAVIDYRAFQGSVVTQQSGG